MKKEKEGLNLRKEAFRKMEQMHPHEVLVYISMIGSAVIFFFTILAFTVSKPVEVDFFKFEFPKSFIVSTVVLLVSNYSVTKIMPHYLSDDIEGLKKWMGITFLLGLIFACFQIIGWKELQAHNILFTGERSGAYLYVISGLHVIHMAGVMGFLLYLLLESHKVSKDVVKHLLYSTSPYQKVKFKILSNCWHFVDAVWVAIFFYFLFSF
ncbi:cytochrome c oxidase subunit 3 [Roseivirga sp.]|uniref:cytochrome c oxidase subunit 3 n=1 Tax=Roseivirga sp. TaxID=1964215 RepID=UPI003B5291E2